MNKERIKEILEKWFKDPIDVPCAYCEAAKEIEQQLKHHEANALKEQMERVIKGLTKILNQPTDRYIRLQDCNKYIENLKAELEGNNG